MGNIDSNAIFSLGYGLYVVTSNDGKKDNGLIVNTVMQLTNDPERIGVNINKANYSHDVIKKTGILNVNTLSESAPFSVFQQFGYCSGKESDKFANEEPLHSENGLAVLKNHINAFISLKVEDYVDLKTHGMFICSITESKLINKEKTMTYAYYFDHVKPKQQAKAAGWVCKICGYIYEGEELPSDYVCPICKHGASDFEKILPEVKVQKTPKWVCSVCGYVYEGENPPEACPQCKASSDKFNKMEGDIALAAEHEFGLYDLTVKNNPNIPDEDKQYIYDQLLANFKGECSEVGMYLCMARVAHREGYGEIGKYWELAAKEEAVHAAKFAEMLGTDLEVNMTDNTPDNLKWRVDCEYGATSGKFDLAAVAKKYNLDAIHDTVHEMARDEARHGKALEALAKRYK